MTNTIDNRVVRMGFDNKQFEGGIRTSISSLDSLKKGLNLEQSARNLTNLANVGKAFSLAGIAEGVQNISNRFSSLGIIGTTTLANLTNAAVNFGKQLLRNLSGIDAILGGFKEYETQIGATQTILANTSMKGTTLDQVNEGLRQLNEYADRTIYNFTEMTRNIGTFTAAGVELDTSIAAIKGIANLAAVSGSNSQQASTAMYQLSQALASGTVKLMDWNSVVNAGMGGQIFQDALKETARLHGVAIDQMITEEGSFRDTLQKGWLTSAVLTETLAKFTGDLSEQQLVAMGYTQDQITQIMKLGEMANDAATKVKTFTQLKDTMLEAIGSGWAQTWMIVLGDFEEAKMFFTDLSDIFGGIIGEASASRNATLQTWKDLGGRTAIITTIKNLLEGLLSVTRPIREAFQDIFPPKTGVALAVLSNTLLKMTQPLKNLGKYGNEIKTVFKGVFAIFDIIGTVLGKGISLLFGSFSKLGGSFKLDGKKILDFLVNISKLIIDFRTQIKSFYLLEKAFIRLKNALSPYIDTVVKFMKGLGPLGQSIRTSLLDTLSKIDFSGFVKMGETLVNFFKNLDFSEIGKSFSDLFSSIDFTSIEKFFSSLKTGAVTFFTNSIDKLTEKLSNVSTFFGNFSDKINSFFKGFGKGEKTPGETFAKTIAESFKKIDWKVVAGLFASGLIVSVFVSIKNFLEKVGGLFENFSGVFGGLKGTLGSAKGILDGVRGSLEAWQSNLKAQTLTTIAIAIGILAVSLIALSLIDREKLANALLVMSLLFLELTKSMQTFSTLGGGNMAKTSVQLLIIAQSLLVLSAAMLIISLIDPNALAKSLVAIGVALLELSIFMNSIRASTFDPKSLSGLIGLSVALIVLSGAVKIFGSMNLETLKQGLIGVGIALAELAAFMAATNFSSFGVKKSLGLLILAASLNVLFTAVRKFGEIDPNKLKQGLIGVGVVLAELAAFIALSSGGSKMISTAVSLVIIAGAMNLLFVAITKFGEMDPNQLFQGLLGMAGALLILAVATNIMQSSIGGAIAITILAVALALLIPSIKTLGELPLKTIGTALLALAGVFVVFGLAGLLLSGLTPILLLLGVAIFMFGAAGFAAGVGLAAFALGLTALIALGVSNLATIKEMLVGVADAIGAAIIAFAKTIADGAPALGNATLVIFRTIISLIVTLIPEITAAALLLVVKLLEELVKAAPTIIKAGFDLIAALLKGIEDNIWRIVTTVGNIIVKFLLALAEELPKIIDAGYKLILSFIDGLAAAIEENGPEINDAVARLAAAVVNGFADGIVSTGTAVAKAIANLAGTAIDALKTLLGIFSPSRVFRALGEQTGTGFVDGLVALTDNTETAAKGLGEKAISGISSSLDKVTDYLAKDLNSEPTIRPVLDLTDIMNGQIELNKLLSQNTFDITGSIKRVSAIEDSNIGKLGVEGSGVTQTRTTEIKFEQNNFSPKTLSALELYRNTKNQLLALKGLGR